MCHQCVEIFDHMGNRVSDPNQNESCYDLVDDRYLAVCPGGTHCSNSLRTDWFIQGFQILFFQRGCETYQPEEIVENDCEYRAGGLRKVLTIIKLINTICPTFVETEKVFIKIARQIVF